MGRKHHSERRLTVLERQGRRRPLGWPPTWSSSRVLRRTRAGPATPRQGSRARRPLPHLASSHSARPRPFRPGSGPHTAPLSTSVPAVATRLPRCRPCRSIRSPVWTSGARWTLPSPAAWAPSRPPHVRRRPTCLLSWCLRRTCGRIRTAGSPAARILRATRARTPQRLRRSTP
ncbi:hypothetical protein VTK73DRAFT_2175 [Phialemonium thermophilum]|uniref:Uncharacterized protein n=1 Tax=Phialemonium thermophilum TaxID=223376 RepID=A0ABR3VSH4_9PEZI